MVEATNPDPIYLKHKAISVLFPYAVWQEQEGQHEMLNIFLQVAEISAQVGFMWHHIEPLVTRLLNADSPIPLKQAIILASPYMPWWQFTNGEYLIQLWAGAALEVPYTDNIGRSMVDTLLRVTYSDALLPHIPDDMWSWLNKLPPLNPVCWGRYWGTYQDVVQTIRTLGDIEILKSYFLLVWSEWDDLRPGGFFEMCISIRGDFSGVGMGDHRQDLLQHLDHVLDQLDLGLEFLQQHKPSLNVGDIWSMKDRYGRLKKILLEVDGQARVTTTGKIVYFFSVINHH